MIPIFNKWVVPLVPVASLHKVDAGTHTALFADQSEVRMEEPEDVDRMTDVDVVYNVKDQMIPFPQD